MTDEFLEQFIAKNGGRYEESHGMDPTFASIMRAALRRQRQSCEKLKQAFYRPAERPVFFDIISNDRLNAFAYASSKGENFFDFIGIFSGAIHTLVAWFVAMYSKPEAFPEITMQELPGSGWKSISIPPSYFDGREVTCSDILRFFTALEMAFAAIDFMTRHEFVHLQNGHLEFIKSTQTTTLISEIESGEATIHWRHRQALEMDADSGAVQKGMHWGFSQLEECKTPLLAPSLTATNEENARYFMALANRQLYATPDRIIATTVAAGYTFFRLYDPKPWDGQIAEGKSHPPLSVRMRTIFGQTITLAEMNRFPGLTTDIALNASLPIPFKLEKIFAEIIGGEPDISAFKSNFDHEEESLRYLRFLKASWAEIRPALNKHKRSHAKLAGGDD